MGSIQIGIPAIPLDTQLSGTCWEPSGLSKPLGLPALWDPPQPFEPPDL